MGDPRSDDGPSSFGDPSSQADAAEKLIGVYLARRLSGEAEAPEAFFGAHPDLADVLRRRFDLVEAMGLLRTDSTSTGVVDPLPSGFDGFEITRILGRGGMGVVYEANQSALHRRVAIKVIGGMSPFSSRMRERFEREITTLARIRHPNIVKVFGSGSVGGTPYVVMELIEGEALTRLLPAARQLPGREEIGRFLTLFVKIARALDYAHGLGVVHRDVKPANILVDARGEPVVLDFGLAREMDRDTLTATGEFVGTLAYTAPEQALGERVDRRADVFGLGATLFHLSTGSPPYSARTVADLVRRFQLGPPSRASSLNSTLPSDFSTVLEHAVAPHPKDRYAGCAELADDLQAVIDGRPIAARPLGRAQRLVRWIRRRPSTAALLVVTTLAVALASSSWMAASRRRSENEYLDSFQEGEALMVTDEGGESPERLERLREAVRCFQSSARIHPEKPESWLRCAEAALRLKSTAEVGPLLEHAAALGTKGFYFRRLQGWLEDGEPTREGEFQPSAPRRETWDSWSPIDRFDLAYVQLIFRDSPRDAYEILSDPALHRDSILLPELLLGVCLARDALSGTPTIMLDRGAEIRLALDAYEVFLRKHPEDSMVSFNRAILIRDALTDGHDLGGSREQLMAWAGGVLRSDVAGKESLEAKGHWIKFLAAKYKLKMEPEVSLTEAMACIHRLSAEEMQAMGELEFLAIPELFVLSGHYPEALDLLRTRNLRFAQPAGPFHMLVMIRENYAAKGQCSADASAIAAFEDSVQRELSSEDEAASRDVVSRLRGLEPSSPSATVSEPR